MVTEPDIQILEQRAILRFVEHHRLFHDPGFRHIPHHQAAFLQIPGGGPFQGHKQQPVLTVVDADLTGFPTGVLKDALQEGVVFRTIRFGNKAVKPQTTKPVAFLTEQDGAGRIQLTNLPVRAENDVADRGMFKQIIKYDFFGRQRFLLPQQFMHFRRHILLFCLNPLLSDETLLFFECTLNYSAVNFIFLPPITNILLIIYYFIRTLLYRLDNIVTFPHIFHIFFLPAAQIYPPTPDHNRPPARR